MPRSLLAALVMASAIASTFVFTACGSLLGADVDAPAADTTSDDGGTASDVTTDADPTATAEGGAAGEDGSTADGSTADGVRCGATLRCAAGEACCWSSSSETGRCIGGGDTCKSDELVLACDVETKCAGGAACCVRYKSLGQTPMGTQCACVMGSDTFEDYPLCTTVAMCATDMMCTAMKSLPPGYSGCGVPPP